MDGHVGAVTAGELKRWIGLVTRQSDEKEQDTTLSILAALGADPKSFRRGKKQTVTQMVTEIYLPPRVTEMLRHMSNHNLTPGLALDLTTYDPDDEAPRDLSIKEKHEKALGKIRRDKPLFVIGSPPCARWCTWQRVNNVRKDPDEIRREPACARVHLEFAAQIHREQIEGRRFFLHEHPCSASSWSEPCISDIMDLTDVDRINADQCQYGQFLQHGALKGQPVMKPTGFMSNAPRLLDKLRKRCSGTDGACSRSKGGEHVWASGRVARDAARYSPELCRAIVKGMVDEVQERGIHRIGEVGLHAVTDEKATTALDSRYSGFFGDDMTGQVLQDDLVHEARQNELKYFCDKGVWVKRPKSKARRRTGNRAISVRWVDVNKGDDMNSKYRWRLVARQLKAHDKS